MTTPANTLRPGKWTVHRSITGAPVGADAAVSGTFPVRSGLLNCHGVRTLLVWPVVTGGGADVSFDVLAYDEDSDTLIVLSSNANKANGVLTEVDVHGQRVFLRVTGVVAGPTAVVLRVSPGIIESAGGA